MLVGEDRGWEWRARLVPAALDTGSNGPVEGNVVGVLLVRTQATSLAAPQSCRAVDLSHLVQLRHRRRHVPLVLTELLGQFSDAWQGRTDGVLP
ncbi:hypothetical protein [Streptomyces sp. NPDC058877]|uniref:hypothetical protein n=1 Tax=unclassified Streptomyces TaxID=2593676 RepID=UPI0036AE5408